MIRLVSTVLGPDRHPDPTRINKSMGKGWDECNLPQGRYDANIDRSPCTNLNRGSSRDSRR